MENGIQIGLFSLEIIKISSKLNIIFNLIFIEKLLQTNESHKGPSRPIRSLRFRNTEFRTQFHIGAVISVK